MFVGGLATDYCVGIRCLTRFVWVWSRGGYGCGSRIKWRNESRKIWLRKWKMPARYFWPAERFKIRRFNYYVPWLTSGRFVLKANFSKTFEEIMIFKLYQPDFMFWFFRIILSPFSKQRYPIVKVNDIRVFLVSAMTNLPVAEVLNCDCNWTQVYDNAGCWNIMIKKFRNNETADVGHDDWSVSGQVVAVEPVAVATSAPLAVCIEGDGRQFHLQMDESEQVLDGNFIHCVKFSGWFYF